MITRQAAQNQANACFMYNAGGFLLAAVGSAVSGSRPMSSLTGVWGLGVIAHAVMLYGVSETREKILMWTAAGMEERKHFQEHVAERVEASTPV